jgi:hypothetical protein
MSSLTVLSVDPGLKHTCFVLMKITKNEEGYTSVNVLWKKVYDLSGKVNPCPDKAHSMMINVYCETEHLWAESDAEGHKRLVLVEFQPPLNTRTNPALVRWNSWVEAFVVSYFRTEPEFLVDYAHPNGVKRHFDIRSGDYHTNKSLALIRARTLVKDAHSVKSDHEADCVLIGAWYFNVKHE